MSFVTACFLLGSISAFSGSAAAVLRYFQQRRPVTSSLWKVGPYPWSVVLIVAGVWMISIGALSATQSDPPTVLLFVAGLALGCCIAVPGVMLIASVWPLMVQDAKEGTYNPPKRSVVGGTLIVSGLVSCGIVTPLAFVLAR